MSVTDSSLIKESRDRYLTYALSVVSGRALPDVRDGLKPVQRRILYAMLQNLNLKPSGSHRKSAAVVGEVLARFHPHGDVACYDAMVRMAQDFSLRYPLVDGQGNFGSLDGDEAAAYRYTEAKLTPLALEVIGEIDEATVAFRDNFDSTISEPVVLPSRVPNLLVNGGSGIAVGMATSIPPHNLKDVVKALLELSEDPEITNGRLSTVLKGPDFPTGCLILNTRKEISEIYRTGRGVIRMRGEWSTEAGPRGKSYAIISSIPYTVNKAQLVEKIADLIIAKKIPQLSDIRDESTTDVRIVMELSSGADPEVAMAYLFKNTPLETNFAVNLTALVPTTTGSCRPELLSLKQCLQHFLDFREEVTKKRLIFEREQLLKRIHILEGLAKIYDRLDEVIKIVRKSDGRQDAALKLKSRFKLSDDQSYAVVDMRIYQLSKTNIEEVRKELKDKKSRVSEIDKLLASKKKISELVRKDLQELSDKFGDKRRSKLEQDNIEIDFRAEDYVVQEDVYAIVTADGWIKRIRQNNEVSSTRLREGDRILRAHPLSTLDSVVFITNHGSLFSLKASEFPSSSGYGVPIQKVLKFRDDETMVESFGVRASAGSQGTMLEAYPHYLQDGDTLVLVTANGVGFALKLSEIINLKRTGKRIMKVREGDQLAAVCRLQDKIAMFTRHGSGLLIKSKEIPVRDSAAVGVSLMGVRDDDRLVSAVSFDSSCKMLMELSTGREKELISSDVVFGHRALKGNKVVQRAEIISVKRQ
ncbi:MAG: DNA topoisomerase 4 subunit A [Deltaproteobacteria bacterium]|nr:DNA topoisomerase 4 subunit A [Deltaproteobacteria bacterium]